MTTDDVFPVCISRGRPQNVKKMQELWPVGLHWLLHEHELEDYKEAGARRWLIRPRPEKRPAGAPPELTLAESRNHAMDLAKESGQYLVMVDDDITAAWNVTGGRHADKVPASLPEVAAEIIGAMETTGAMLGGAAYTGNPMHAQMKLIAWCRLTTQFMVVRPDAEPRVPWDLSVADEVWLTAAHLKRYGHVARLGHMMVDARWDSDQSEPRPGTGGLTEYRNRSLRLKACQRTLEEFPEILKKRGNGSINLDVNHMSKSDAAFTAEARFNR